MTHRPEDLPHFANLRDGELILTSEDDERGEPWQILAIVGIAFIVATTLLVWLCA